MMGKALPPPREHFKVEWVGAAGNDTQLHHRRFENCRVRNFAPAAAASVLYNSQRLKILPKGGKGLLLSLAGRPPWSESSVAHTRGVHTVGWRGRPDGDLSDHPRDFERPRWLGARAITRS
mmetsp:Transcript_92071/g.264968  ORF Transcript_92071/g.264968 Transcript_92071/m.264968 type:complete len:121 (-) Transcript_92071:146-508(-)